MNKKTLFTLLLVVILDAIGFGIVFPLFPVLLFDRHLDFLPQETSQSIRGIWLGALLSITPIIQMIISPIVGSLSDRIGRRPCIVGCLSLGAIGYVAAAFGVSHQSICTLLIGRILIGIAIASFAVVNACITDLSATDEEKGSRFALVGICFGIGFIVGPPLGSLFAGTFLFKEESLSRPFFVNSLLTIINAFLAWRFLPETKKSKSSASSKNFFHDLKTVSSSEKRLPILFLTAFLFTFGWAFYISVIPVWWVQGLHCSQSEISLLVSGATIVYVLTCFFLVGPLIRRFSPIKIVSTDLLILSLAIWASFLFGTSLFAYWIFLPLQNVFVALVMPIIATIVSDLAPKEHQGKAMGIFGASESLGFGLAPVLAGVCLGAHLLLPTIISGFFLLISFFLLRRIRCPRK